MHRIPQFSFQNENFSPALPGILLQLWIDIQLIRGHLDVFYHFWSFLFGLPRIWYSPVRARMTIGGGENDRALSVTPGGRRRAGHKRTHSPAVGEVR